MRCFSKKVALLIQVDGVCRACLILNAEGRNLFRCKDHDVCEVICGRDMQLHRKFCIIYDTERWPVEMHVDMIKLEISNRGRLPKVIHGIHHLPDIKDSSG